MGVLFIILSNKSIKKFILLLLFVALPAQAITMSSWLSFLNMKSSLSQFHPDIGEIFKKCAMIGGIALGGSIITFLSIRHFKKRQKSRAEAAAKAEAADKEARRAEEERSKAAAVQKEAQENSERIRLEREDQQKREAERVRLAKIQKEEREKAILEEQRAEIAEIARQEVAGVDFYESKENVGPVAEKVAGEVAEPPDDFVEVDREIGFKCSQLTYGYVKALFNQNVSLQDYINQANSYSPEDRKKLAKIIVNNVDAEDEDEGRAFEYIENGYKNFAHILNGNFDAVPGYDQVVGMSDEEIVALQSEERAEEKEQIRQSYLSSMVSVVWCLYDCALRTGDAFIQGAFHEKSKNLYNFFLRYISFVNQDYKKMGLFGGNCNHPFAYQRVSTHLEELSKIKDICQYGIDIRFDKNGLACGFLPNKMTHILFIPYDSEDYKLILKPENYCMYNPGEIASHGSGAVRSKWETLAGSSNSEKHYRKERTPKKITSDFAKLMAQGSIDEEKRDQYNAEVKAWGIQRIVSLAADEFKEDTDIRSYVEELKREYNDTDKRFGREVIFGKAKLKELVNCE